MMEESANDKPSASNPLRWLDLTSHLLLGISRRGPLPAHSLPRELPAVQTTPNDDGGQAALQVLAGWSIAYLSGHRLPEVRLPKPDEERDRARLEERPLCSREAEIVLGRILRPRKGQPSFETFLPEWMRLAEAAKVRAPAVALPLILTAAPSFGVSARQVAAAGGYRAEWLARQRQEWSWARQELTFEDWKELPPPDRALVLLNIRQLGPATGRKWFAELFPAHEKQRPKDAEKLIGALHAGLSADDEPLLETLLGEARASLRHAAAELLACLPESAYADRQRLRIEEHLRPEPPFGGTGKRLRDLPENALPKDWQADGIGSWSSDRLKTDKWYAATVDLIGSAPLGMWDEIGFDHLLRLAARTLDKGLTSAVETALCLAAARQKSVEHLPKALDICLKTEAGNREIILNHTGLPQALALVPAERLETILNWSLQDRQRRLDGEHPLIQTLSAMPGIKLTVPFATALTECIARSVRVMAKTDPGRWQLLVFLKQRFVHQLPLPLVAESAPLFEHLAHGPKLAREDVKEFGDALLFRDRLRRAFATRPETDEPPAAP